MNAKSSTHSRVELPSSQTLTESVLAVLEQDIISGRLRPRERLIETELSLRLGISRAPIREALRMLESEGLVSKGPRGLQVTDISLEEVSEIFEILANLEELYTRRAVERVSREDRKTMAALLSQMEACVKVDEVERYFELNDRFHLVLRNACPNRRVIQVLSSLGKQTLRFRRFAMSLPGRLSESIKEHRRIMEAVERGDAAAAGQRARESAEQAYRMLTEFLQRSGTFL
jgi:DNA-binding GntR family transcriptional regulator